MVDTIPHDLSTNAGYMRRFYELLMVHRADKAPNREAWEELEREREATQGSKRFSSYGSFRYHLCRNKPKTLRSKQVVR